jgi:glutathione synthase/RimK-type ligase-like ATP-grasp enzyme
MDVRLAGISRKTEFSPNHVLNDFLIIKRTSEELENLGARVTIYEESILTEDLVKEPFVFSMVQGNVGCNTLIKISKNKKLVINSPQSVLNCYRYNMVKLLPGNGIPFPQSIIISTEASNINYLDFNGKYWVKRGDAHAVHKEDVTLVYNNDEAMSTLKEFSQRGISSAVLQENLCGDTVKFYAVRETDFFHWYFVNGFFHPNFEHDRLRELAERSAEILGLYVYGGDAIITPESDIYIIDINDWPSFAPVRDEASRIIAELIYKKALENE